MNKYRVEAKGYFGLPFVYIVEANDKDSALEAGKKLLEQEYEWATGNISKLLHGGMKVVKKLQK